MQTRDPICHVMPDHVEPDHVVPGDEEGIIKEFNVFPERYIYERRVVCNFVVDQSRSSTQSPIKCQLTHSYRRK